MAEFNLERFKYRWRGDWSSGTSYRRDDVVRIGGKSYVCLISHTSSAAFRTDLNAILPDSNPPQLQPRWTVMTSGKSFQGNWTTDINYELGDVVLFQGSLYVCTTAHLSTVFSDNINNWAVYTSSLNFVGNWFSDTVYAPNAIVKYNGISYKCVSAHTSQLTLELDQDKWEVFSENIEFRGPFALSTDYRKNDLVRYGGSIFRCIETHTSFITFDDSKFQLELPGSQFDGIWDSTQNYNQGDIVQYGGYLYFAVNNNTDSDPSRESDDSTVDWIVLAKTYDFKGTWSPTGKYKTGDIVQRGGRLYVALQDVNLSQGDDSTLNYLNTDVWEIIIDGQIFSDQWTEDRLYSVGEVVTYLGSAYICNEEHSSTGTNFPGDNGNGFEYWNTLIQAGIPGGMQAQGDLLTFGLQRENIGDGSTLGDTRVPIGTTGQKLSVSDELEVFWRNTASAQKVIYVSTNGVDDDGYGLDPKSPFKSIRYACEYIEDNFDPLTLAKVSVTTGRYEEIGPIIIPAGCVVMGDELRSTTIVANNPLTEYSNDYQYVDDYFDFLSTFIFNIITNTENTGGYTDVTEQNRSLPPGNSAAANEIVNLSLAFKQYAEFRINSEGTDPILSGSNTLNSDINFRNASAILLANKNYISNEIYAYLQDTYPSVTFNRTRVSNDVKSFIRGAARDLKYSGNYGTIQAARRYTNAVLGSQQDDMFYCRDTTGLRNCTVDGLQGSLNPPGVFAQYQRPTGGSYCSLDPGWGPDDSRTWIVNRSPYIQGVTTLGNAAVGQKIDGSLHNGGNKSMVSNDFTQVISDGIGAWVLNNGRAELVSVFTYYAQVGYLAENGGIIRATNGNNSYGQFGSIAEGNDPNETPQNVTVFNRNNEAQVENAFAGGPTDELKIFQYSHCGEQYTTASTEIIGAGSAASVTYDHVRYGALSQARLINTQGSGTEGGSNFLVRQNNAQATSSAQDRIILSANDPTQFESEILGMRIIIVSGDGIGQYGYIQAYNPSTRVVTVYKESDGTAGWDHIIPGTPIESALDTTAIYRIEPRVETNAPGFSSQDYTFNESRDFIDMAYGTITNDYFSLIGQTGSGDTFGGTPAPAVFNVNRKGTVYNVTMIDPGSGYSIGDVITLTGDNLGGSTPTNDLVITVTAVSDDSTNSIISFTSTGTGRPGRFVAISDPSLAYYSDDGETWSEVSLSFTGTFKKVIAGNDLFVALAENENTISFSFDGASWTTRSLPSSETWIDIAYGNGRFVAIAENTNAAAYSLDGQIWSSSTLPTGDDSTGDQWQSIAFGQNRFVVISGSATKDVAYSTNGASWARFDNVLPAGDYNWVSLAYGDNRFIALSSDGSTVYSVDKGENWYAGDTAPINSLTLLPLTWHNLKFGNGVFFAFGTEAGGSTDFCATTETGLQWTGRNISSTGEFKAYTWGLINNEAYFVAIGSQKILQGVVHIQVGKKAILRGDVFQGKFQNMLIWDPGSNYNESTDPLVVTVTDNQYGVMVETENFIRNGVLPQPDFNNRGSGYRTSTSTITIEGDGFADIVFEDNTLVVAGVETVPPIGTQIRIQGIEEPTTADPDDLKLFNSVGVTDLGDDGSGNGTKLVQFTISPSLDNTYNLRHDTSVELRSRFSQCRISGHDFLDIGTGNFLQTNYPDLYAGGAFFTAAPENEVLEVDGGRVFYTSTDQDGNFRAGELFGVDQATGIVTISAEFFNLDGLSELALGGIRLGGSGAVVQEFSTDPNFTEDSNNVVPTQRAIASFLQNRLSVGGSDLETNQIQAGSVIVGGVDNQINTTGVTLQIPRDVTFDGQDSNGNLTNISGSIIMQMMLLQNYNDTVQ